VKRFRFMPTEENFFDLFDEIAQVLVDAAVCLQDLINNYEDVEQKTRNLREMEKRVDSATDGICERLNTSFVTPIDREDIHGLATKMDDVLDYIEASSDRMKLYGVEKPREEAGEIADLLVEGTKLIRQAVHALSHFRDIQAILDPCIEINKIENQADQVQRRALKRLFAEETRPLEVAKWQEIFDRLETATDRCEDVANILESIVVKNA
jgi:predicted phosphate transport protein (TIGR00153 family)